MVGETANRRGPSEREHLTIQRAAEGCKNREIADWLGTTAHVVKNICA
jgi:DNA-binding NarL/FixJ family response regulator